jgi:16S rRNA processing protein RimM
MADTEEFVPVGKISGAFGVKGWVKVFSYTEPRTNILQYSPLYLARQNGWVEVKVSGGHMQGKGVVMGLENVTDRDQVTPLIGSELAIKKHQLKPAQKNEYYWADLVGLQVITEQGASLGEVDHLLETGAHDVLVVNDKAKKTERLIPFVMDEIVQSVDLDKHYIQVNWQEDY